MKTKYNQRTKHRKTQAPWWDQECETAKSYKYSLLRKFRYTNDLNDLQNYKISKAKFKKICRLND